MSVCHAFVCVCISMHAFIPVSRSFLCFLSVPVNRNVINLLLQSFHVFDTHWFEEVAFSEEAWGKGIKYSHTHIHTHTHTHTHTGLTSIPCTLPPHTVSITDITIQPTSRPLTTSDVLPYTTCKRLFSPSRTIIKKEMKNYDLAQMPQTHDCIDFELRELDSSINYTRIASERILLC